MAKPMYVYTGSQWVPVASELESTSQYATTTYVDDKVGLVHINTTSFSAVASQDILNVFSSTYDHYLVLFKAATNADNININMRLGVGASFTSTNVYSFGINTVTRAGSASNVAQNAGSSLRVSAATTTTPSVANFYIFNPNIASETQYTIQGWNRRDNFSLSGAGYVEVSTQFTDLQIFPASSTMTGTASVYGVKK